MDIQVYHYGSMVSPRRQYVLRTDDQEEVRAIQEQLWAIGLGFVECPEYYEETKC